MITANSTRREAVSDCLPPRSLRAGGDQRSAERGRRRRGANLSRPADQDGGAVPAGRADRHHGTARGSARLGPILGQTVIIENRAGAGGALGTKAVAGAEPDGYTLLFGNASALVVGPAVYRFRHYDTVKHFTPIAKVTEGYEVLVVAPDFPAKNVQELVAYAKARPGKLNFGSMGYGNLTHLTAELFKLQTGTDFVHVPYKGSPEAVAGIVAGEVHVLFGEVAGLLPLVRAGKIRALGVASATRNALAPDLPTMIEGGIPDFVALTFTGW